VLYVLQNAARHAERAGRAMPRGWIDPYSSAARWVHPPPIAPPTVWLLNH